MKPVILLSALFLVASTHAQQPANCCNPYPKTITVSGSAELEVVPDQIYVQVVLKEYDKSKNTKIELDSIKRQFANIYKLSALPDSILSVGNIEGENRYNWYNIKQRRKRDLNQYQSIAYNIKCKNLKQVESIADLLDDNATESFNITKISHSKMTEFRKQIKTEAVKAAKNKGIYLTEAIDEKLGVAITIVEPKEYESDRVVNGISSNTFSQMNMRLNNRENSSLNDNEGKSGLNFTTIKIRYEVEVLFALK
jgi:uncharacterized protein